VAAFDAWSIIFEKNDQVNAFFLDLLVIFSYILAREQRALSCFSAWGDVS